MMLFRKIMLIVIFGNGFFIPAKAQLRLPRIIRDSMVLQREATIPIWGWSRASEMVSVKFNHKTYRTRSGKDGRWIVKLLPMRAGGPYDMEISAGKKILLREILIGDVWLCAGQSNMEHQLKLHAVRYENEIRSADYPAIRQFKVPDTVSLSGLLADISGGSWEWACPANLREFSAVAYFFARTLYDKYHVPIGIVNCTWGGIPVESAMSEEALKAFPYTVRRFEKELAEAEAGQLNGSGDREWQRLQESMDEGISGRWFEDSCTITGWKRIAVPGFWEDQGARDLYGIIWYRKEIDLPASMTGQTAWLWLGRMVDADEVYLNGRKIGSTGYMYPQRRYQVPEGLLKPGKNLLAVRVTCFGGKGGFVPDKPLLLISGKDTVNLSGYWEYKPGVLTSPHKSAPAVLLQNQPAALFNSMLAPLMPYALRGFIWYQGESNIFHADEYANLQNALINDWRKHWKQDSLPFLFVQLPGYGDYHYQPAESQWALFREAQARSLSLPNTAMVTTIDLGEWNDIHPDRKKEVGERLALAAEKIAYGENNVFSGPVFQSASFVGNKVIIQFGQTGSGLTTIDGGKPNEFSIAGADGIFVWARATIEHDRVVVWNDAIAEPRYVRYAWADQPVNPNLYNREGIPAQPFRYGK